MAPTNFRRFLVFAVAAVAAGVTVAVRAERPCEIQVIDRESRWPVPLVILRTTHNVVFVTDNAGRVAFDLPELMGQETALTIEADGYEARADGFGYRLARVTPRPGEKITIEVDRTSIARRVGRITGAGLFAESQKLGLEKNWKESGIVGCDSVQNAVHRGRMYWAWGDTTIASYPLGILHATSATSTIRPLRSFEPPLRLKLTYFTDEQNRPRAVAKMPGDGPTWLSGYVSLPDNSGKKRLVATYVKIKPPLEAYESGLCVWNEESASFEKLRTLWTKSAPEPKEPHSWYGHPVIVDGKADKKFVLVGDPLPKLRFPATFEAWQDFEKWEFLTPQETVPASDGRTDVKPSSGSIAWNEFRQRWVTVFMQTFGQPSAFGEVWYAEADSPYGPWGPAVKVLSHKNYTFYNPRLHPEFTPDNSPILLFEGTYTATFANNPPPTPRYDYNQILYRLDLDDPKLAPARRTSIPAAASE